MHISKNNMILGAVAGAVLLGASFWGGMTYAKGSAPMRGGFAGANGAQFAGRAGAGGTGARGAAAGGFTAGQILSKDANGITIKMMDGSTKIILVSGSTQVMKQASGTQDDLSVGTNVTITGSANSDGSITAQSVQIRPAGTATPRATTPAQ
ncbi:MAG TPA: hypothetical protein VGP13_03160 [Candidatus Paceibacterota bacterium]|jgi:hypothetical protein|nr:hypothetical protein [Candidatus Paceibacterota bacterium]